MEINDFLGIGIVGVAISGIVEFVKAKLGTTSIATKGITVGLSIVLGGAYFLFRETVWWATMLGVLASASMVYAFVFKSSTPQ